MEPPKIIVLNQYFAREGMADAVLRTRQEASRVRAAIGLAPGRILRRVVGPDNLPTVLWECEYENLAAHDQDMDRRAASARFEAVRARMRSLLDRFERTSWAIEHHDPNGYRSYGPDSVTVLNAYYPAPDRSQAVLVQRIHASDVRASLGHPGGRVLRRIGPTAKSGAELPEVMWQLDYPSLDTRRVEADAVTSTPEFKAVMRQMRSLVAGFERGIWQEL